MGWDQKQTTVRWAVLFCGKGVVRKTAKNGIHCEIEALKKQLAEEKQGGLGINRGGT